MQPNRLDISARYRKGEPCSIAEQQPVGCGACWLFTVNLAVRKQALLVRDIDQLREVIRYVKQQPPSKLVPWW
ncbi:MAG: hypothetical protein ACRDC6_24465 [Shewanella sp.]